MAVHKIPTFRLVCGMAILNWIAYFVVIIVKILEHNLFCFKFGYCSLCWKFVTLCKSYLEFILKTIYHNMFHWLTKWSCHVFNHSLIQQSNNHQFISSCFLCLYQILRFSSGLVNKIHWWEARERSKVKPQSKWPIFWMTLWVAIVYCIEFIPHLVYGFQKKFIFFVNCVYCQR